MPDDKSTQDYASAIGSGAIDGAAELMKTAGKTMLKDTPAITRYVLTKVPDGPGFIANLADVATAKDKPRAMIGVVGGMAGGTLGALGAGPVGAAVGSAAGEAGSEWVYDHRQDLAQKAADTAQWMKDRTAGAIRGLTQGLPPFVLNPVP